MEELKVCVLSGEGDRISASPSSTHRSTSQLYRRG
jgi:hypothetical protein